jgi:hypothetical protein
MPSCLDMALRGRPVSDTPEQTVEKLSEATHVPRPRDKNTKANRLSGLGPFDRIVAGVGPESLLHCSDGGMETAAASRDRSHPPDSRWCWRTAQ